MFFAESSMTEDCRLSGLVQSKKFEKKYIYLKNSEMAIKIEEESNNDNNIVKEQFQKSKQGSWIVNKLENYFYW